MFLVLCGIKYRVGRRVSIFVEFVSVVVTLPTLLSLQHANSALWKFCHGICGLNSVKGLATADAQFGRPIHYSVPTVDLVRS